MCATGLIKCCLLWHLFVVKWARTFVVSLDLMIILFDGNNLLYQTRWTGTSTKCYPNSLSIMQGCRSSKCIGMFDSCMCWFLFVVLEFWLLILSSVLVIMTCFQVTIPPFTSTCITCKGSGRIIKVLHKFHNKYSWGWLLCINMYCVSILCRSFVCLVEDLGLLKGLKRLKLPYQQVIYL